VKLTSWQDFRLKFGGFIPNSNLAYAVRGFFATGGTTCYVVRVGAAASPPATAVLPLPAATPAALITFLTADSAAGQNQIRLESSDVVSVGELIAIGDPEKGELLSVASIVDDQTITVKPAAESSHAASDPVYHVEGSALKVGVAAGATDLPLINTTAFHDEDLVVVEGGGLSEIRVIINDPANSTIHLASPLVSLIPPGQWCESTRLR